MKTPIQQFFADVAQNRELEAKLAGLRGASREHVLGTILQVAADAGHRLTEKELRDALGATDEMTAEQLEQLTGGIDVLGQASSQGADTYSNPEAPRVQEPNE